MWEVEHTDRFEQWRGTLALDTTDPKLSTMRKLTAALGGTLHIEVRVGDRSIELGTDADE